MVNVIHSFDHEQENNRRNKGFANDNVETNCLHCCLYRLAEKKSL